MIPQAQILLIFLLYSEESLTTANTVTSTLEINTEQ